MWKINSFVSYLRLCCLSSYLLKESILASEPEALNLNLSLAAGQTPPRCWRASLRWTHLNPATTETSPQQAIAPWDTVKLASLLQPQNFSSASSFPGHDSQPFL